MYKTRNHFIFVSCKTVLRSKYRNHVLAWLTHIKFRKETRMAKEWKEKPLDSDYIRRDSISKQILIKYQINNSLEYQLFD